MIQLSNLGMKTVYIDFREVGLLPRQVMEFIYLHSCTEKKPIPRQKIVSKFKAQGVKPYMTVNALHFLLKKGYIREAVVISNKTFYVLLRRMI